MTATLTAERVRELFEYDSDSGVLSWKVAVGKAKTGKQAGCLVPDGYVKVGISGCIYAIHRVIWLYVHGHWPRHDIDHLNGDRADNRLANLRDVTRSVNSQNLKRARVTSKSGLLGVSRHKGRKTFQAQIKTSGRSRHIGSYSTPEEAHSAYLDAKREEHPGCCI